MFSFRTSPLADQMDKALTGGRVGVVATPACYDPVTGQYVWDIFRDRGNLEFLCVPSGGELDPSSSLPAIPDETLSQLDALVVDIRDAGSRYFPHTRFVCSLIGKLSMMENPPAVYVVDHVNPAGRFVEGTVPVVQCEPSTPRVAHRHGLTIGELCYLCLSESGGRFALHVISARAGQADRMLLPWGIPPSADLPGMFSCLMYSGGALWEHSSVSSAQGSSRPYEFVGAPYLSQQDVRYLPAPEGVFLRPCSFTPSQGQYRGELCNGFQIIPGPGALYHSFLHTVLLMRSLLSRYSQFEFRPGFAERLADPVVSAYLREEITFDVVQEHVKSEEQRWIRRAKRFLLYDDAPVRMK